MKYTKILSIVLVALIGFTSCDDDDSPVNQPNLMGKSVTVTNTLQSGTTNGVETPIEQVFGLDEGSLSAATTVTMQIEFPNYIFGLYEIDVTERTISFELIAPDDDPNFMDFYRTLETGTVDRYYFTFAEPHNVNGFSTDNSSVNLRIDSDTVLVVETGEGYEFQPETQFTITLN